MGGFVGFLVSEVLDSFDFFSFFFFFSQSLAQWKHFPHHHPEESPNKVLYGSTAEMENTAPRFVPIGLQCLQPGKSWRALTASPVLLQCSLQHGCEQRLQPANGFFKHPHVEYAWEWCQQAPRLDVPQACGGRGDLWVPEAGPPGSGSSSALCFQARAYGQGGPKEAEVRRNLSIKSLIMQMSLTFGFL